ncbi:hypothetical protein GGI22_002503, partial [Coemansia erecta]
MFTPHTRHLFYSGLARSAAKGPKATGAVARAMRTATVTGRGFSQGTGKQAAMAKSRSGSNARFWRTLGLWAVGTGT